MDDPHGAAHAVAEERVVAPGPGAGHALDRLRQVLADELVEGDPAVLPSGAPPVDEEDVVPAPEQVAHEAVVGPQVEDVGTVDERVHEQHRRGVGPRPDRPIAVEGRLVAGPDDVPGARARGDLVDLRARRRGGLHGHGRRSRPIRRRAVCGGGRRLAAAGAFAAGAFAVADVFLTPDVCVEARPTAGSLVPVGSATWSADRRASSPMRLLDGGEPGGDGESGGRRVGESRLDRCDPRHDVRRLVGELVDLPLHVDHEPRHLGQILGGGHLHALRRDPGGRPHRLLLLGVHGEELPRGGGEVRAAHDLLHRLRPAFHGLRVRAAHGLRGVVRGGGSRRSLRTPLRGVGGAVPGRRIVHAVGLVLGRGRRATGTG